MSDSRAGVLLPDMSLILLRLLDISNLFCEMTSRCSFVVGKQEVVKEVTCSFRCLNYFLNKYLKLDYFLNEK